MTTFGTISVLRISASLTVLLACCSIFEGCRSSKALLLQDTEGRKFTGNLDEPELTYLKLFPAPEASSRYDLRRSGHIIAACPAPKGGAEAPITQCRALVCRADADCPPAHGLTQGTCINALCTEPARDLIADDAIVLCLAGTGADYSSAAQVERFALGLNCGQPCRVPSPCRQP